MIDDTSDLEKNVTTSLENYNYTLETEKIKKVMNPVIYVNNKCVEKLNVVKLPTLKINKFYRDISLFQDLWYSFKGVLC